MEKISWQKLEKKNLQGKVFILPTDTIYGLSTLYDDEVGIEKIRQIKNRAAEKDFIILVSGLEDLSKFGIEINDRQKDFLNKIWPGRITVVFSVEEKTIAIRVPKHTKLRDFIEKVGPIVSTSVNKTGEDITVNVKDISEEISGRVDCYIDEGELSGSVSTIVQILR